MMCLKLGWSHLRTEFLEQALLQLQGDAADDLEKNGDGSEWLSHSRRPYINQDFMRGPPVVPT